MTTLAYVGLRNTWWKRDELLEDGADFCLEGHLQDNARALDKIVRGRDREQKTQAQLLERIRRKRQEQLLLELGR